MHSHKVEPPSSKPVPFAIVKVQLKRLVQQYQERTHKPGVIATKDLLALIAAYEHEHQVVLLTEQQKQAILPYTRSAPDLEMTLDDILSLLKLVCAPAPVASVSAPTFKLDALPRTSSPLTQPPQPAWKRRMSTVSLQHQNDDEQWHAAVSSLDEFDDHDRDRAASSRTAHLEHDLGPQRLGTTYEEETDDADDDEKDDDEYDQYYRRSLALTQRLKQSEQSLASMTRDNEDRILVLQDRVDEMNDMVTKQKRELIEYKTKESNSLEQISMLEQHIANIEQSETDQKQVYLSIKTLFDEKCVEAQKLQELLKQKELDLQQTEVYLCHFRHEFKQLNSERERLMMLQRDLEHELHASQHTHTQLAEQRSENDRLKQVIDTLRTDLEHARIEHQNQQLPTSSASNASTPSIDSAATSSLILSLEAELEAQLQKKEDEHTKIMEKVKEMEQTEQRLRSAESEKNYYKLQATEAKKDLDRVKDELLNLKRTILDAAGQQQQQQQQQQGSVTSSPPTSSASSASQPNMWTLSRQRQRRLDHGGKRREILDLHDARPMAQRAVSSGHGQQRVALRHSNNNDKVINSTTTFALYTLLVYIFGIVTSTFLIDNGIPSGLEQALVAAASSQGFKGRLFEILLYWIEKLLFEGEGVLT
ncbi:hypothetical protein BC940DRAFT_273139 [Gongronella butleri]|nr:hypothetical protein BC940DRAFT_273139 [Gongronella butleri]